MSASGLLIADSWHTDLFDIPAYLEALNIVAAPPDLKLLEKLHWAHVHTLTFANVDVLLGNHPGVGPDAVQAQLVDRQRGGYCFEHAQIFAAALEYLGFDVRRTLGRVHALSSARTHTTVHVDLEGRRYMCDPGFGFSVTGPIPLEDGAMRMEGDQQFGIEQRMDDGSPIWALTRQGKAEHFMDELPVHPVDIRTGHLFTSTSPQSVFTQHLMVMRHTNEGHVTVTEGAVTTRIPGRVTERREISAAEAVHLTRDLGVRISDHEARRLQLVLEELQHPQVLP